MGALSPQAAALFGLYQKAVLGILLSLALALPVSGIWNGCWGSVDACRVGLYETFLQALLIMLGIMLPAFYAARTRVSDRLNEHRAAIERCVSDISASQNAANEALQDVEKAKAFVAKWKAFIFPGHIRTTWIDTLCDEARSLIHDDAYEHAIGNSGRRLEFQVAVEQMETTLKQAKQNNKHSLQASTVLIYGAVLCFVVLLWPTTFMGTWAILFVGSAVLALFLMLLQSVIGINVP